MRGQQAAAGVCGRGSRSPEEPSNGTSSSASRRLSVYGSGNRGGRDVVRKRSGLAGACRPIWDIRLHQVRRWKPDVGAGRALRALCHPKRTFRRDGRGQRGGPDAPCPPVRYAALLLYLRIRPTPLPACATPGLFVEETQQCRSGMRGSAIAKVKEEGRAAARGTRSNCAPLRPTAMRLHAGSVSRRSQPTAPGRFRT